MSRSGATEGDEEPTSPEMDEVRRGLPEPPPELQRRAHKAGEGELLWPRDAAVDAVSWAAAAGIGIRGGEVYSPAGPFAAVMVEEWHTEPPWGPGEDWDEYVRRGLDRALAEISRDREPPSGTDTAGRSLYFLAYQSPGEGS
jgi:hypothetical protein